ncbi:MULTISPECIES: DUF202 domain-containing protein [unclassified Crossiella]|uniref:YidH family protein n=1 Tax=unclassified Crossiella TaxID=2620835 RepID=UPI001FFED461|nr:MULTISPECIES: DUF202 domain-containing protein [unclassified Crossiella]MCK2243971.1 DUF202 domain-containing protein [Crossiella sp. S99.2]MCK2257171.1 DUF202 domain-containing protein [Crossiella sp. S99.1]
MTSRRWPGFVYDAGDEPDPRFTLANERTFLAWIRTALGLMAGGVAVEALGYPGHGALRAVLAVSLLLAGVLCAGTAFFRWAAAERAMRLGQPLPGPFLLPVLGALLVLAGLLAVLMVLV